MITTTSDGVRTEKSTADLGTSLAQISDTMTSKANVESVEFCNKTAGAITVELTKQSGSSEFYYLKGKSIAANEIYVFEAHVIVLQAGEILRAKASAGTSIDVHVTSLQASSTKPA